MVRAYGHVQMMDESESEKNDFKVPAPLAFALPDSDAAIPPPSSHTYQPRNCHEKNGHTARDHSCLRTA